MEKKEKEEKEFVFPPYGPYVPPVKEYRWYPCREKEEFVKVFAAIDEKYNHDQNTSKNILAKGTTVYRGTLFNTLYNPNSTGLIFFGLDVVISTWILLENYNGLKEEDKAAKTHGFIHEFKLARDLPYEYISDVGCNPENAAQKCNPMPCVHPQVILHTGSGGCDDYKEVGTELTLPLKYVNKCWLTYVNTYKVEIETLKKHQDEHYLQFKFKKHLVKMSKDEYNSHNFILFPHASIKQQTGAGKSKKTKEKIHCKDGKTRVVYVGPRGGRYVKIQGELKRLTN